jgi:hypothetical protein
MIVVIVVIVIMGVFGRSWRGWIMPHYATLKNAVTLLTSLVFSLNLGLSFERRGLTVTPKYDMGIWQIGIE